MKIIKKIVIGLVVLFVLLIGTVALIPVFFKDELVQLVKETANENLNAKVDFGDFDLSLLSSYPYFLFEIENVSVIGVDTFATDTLAHIGKLKFDVDLGSVLAGNYVVNSFEIKDLVANAIVLEDGTANWDVMPTDSTAVEDVTEDTKSAPIKFDLKNYQISNARIVYDDRQGNMKAEILNLNHGGVFNMNGDSMYLKTSTNIEGVTYVQDGVRLMNKVKTTAEAELELDLASMYFAFKKNEFALNELKLGVDGWFAMPGDEMDFDLVITAKENKFGEVLSLIPAVYKTDLAGITTKGDFSLVAAVKGKMTEEQLPGFDVDLSVKDGFFQYPDLPEAVKNIQVELHVNNQSGIIDQTVVDLDLFHFEIMESPIDIKLHATQLETDPTFSGDVKSKMNLENLSKVIPMEDGENYQGRINANLSFGGKLSSIEKEQYEDFKANGNITLIDFLYESADLPMVKVKNMSVNFAPQYFELANLDLIMGKSDLNAKGRIDNILPFVLHNDTIAGSFTIASNYFNLDELMIEDAAAVSQGEATPVDTTPMSIIEIPGNIDFVLNSSFKKIDYDNMPIDNLKGKLLVKESVLKFEKTSLTILGGEITLDGYYSTKDPKLPTTNMQIGIQKMEIPIAFKTFNTVEKMAPIAEKAKGHFSTKLDFKTNLDNEMMPIYNSLTGGGDLLTENLSIENATLFEKVAGALKNPKLKKMKAEDLKIKYQFKDGKVFVEPFDLKVGNITAKVHGWNSFEQTLEYVFEFKIPRSEFGGEANKVLNSLESQAAKFGAKVDLGEFVLVNVVATGAMSDPKIKVMPKGTEGKSGGVKEQAKEIVKEKVDELKNKAKEEADKLKKEAEEKAKAEADRLKQEAEVKAKAESDRLKKEAEAKIEAEKKKQAEELKKKGSGLLKGFGR